MIGTKATTVLWFNSYADARRAFNELVNSISESTVVRVFRSHGMEEISLKDGTVLKFRTNGTGTCESCGR